MIINAMSVEREWPTFKCFHVWQIISYTVVQQY